MMSPECTNTDIFSQALSRGLRFNMGDEETFFSYHSKLLAEALRTKKTDGTEKSPQLLIPFYCYRHRHEDQRKQLNSVIFLLHVIHSELSWREEAGSVFTHHTSAYPAIPLGREGILSPGQGRIVCIQGSFVLFRIRGPPASTVSHISSVQNSRHAKAPGWDSVSQTTLLQPHQRLFTHSQPLISGIQMVPNRLEYRFQLCFYGTLCIPRSTSCIRLLWFPVHTE